MCQNNPIIQIGTRADPADPTAKWLIGSYNPLLFLGLLIIFFYDNEIISCRENKKRENHPIWIGTAVPWARVKRVLLHGNKVSLRGVNWYRHHVIHVHISFWLLPEWLPRVPGGVERKLRIVRLKPQILTHKTCFTSLAFAVLSIFFLVYENQVSFSWFLSLPSSF